MLSSRGGSANDVLRREGLAAVTAAIAAGEANVDTFTWKALLELGLARPEDALDTFAAAERALDPGLTPWMHSHRCEAYAALGRPEEALADAKQAVADDTDDLALRSNTVTALITAARVELLPIASVGDLRRYQDLIEWRPGRGRRAGGRGPGPSLPPLGGRGREPRLHRQARAADDLRRRHRLPRPTAAQPLEDEAALAGPARRADREQRRNLRDRDAGRDPAGGP
jgi:tetratricopeptide (TPR) repeat protein